MTIVVSTSAPIWNFDNNGGQPLVGGQLFSYLAGTSTPAPTYVDSTGSQANTNPILLNAHGDTANASGVSCGVWIPPNTLYKFVLEDPLGNTIWTLDNYQQFGLTQGNLGPVLYPQTPAEILASITPVNFIYPGGNVLRYGADPTGAASSVTAINNAIQVALAASTPTQGEIYFPDGNYLIDSQIVINPGISVVGLAFIGSDKTKAVLTQTAAAGANASIFYFSAQLFNSVRIEHLGFSTNNPGLTQACLRFTQVRTGSRIFDCQFNGNPTKPVNTADATAIQFDGGGTYTAEIVVAECNIGNFFRGIVLNGVVTDATIGPSNTISSGGTGTVNCVAINIANTVSGARIIGNEIQGFGGTTAVGINSGGAYLFQYGNYFQSNTTDFSWSRGSGNTFINNTSLYDLNPSGLVATYPKNNVDGCVVVTYAQSANPYFDNQRIETGKGFREYLRSFNLGDFTTRTFAAGNYTGNGSMTWTVASAANDSSTIVGHTATYNWFVSGTTIGGTPSTALQIALPAGLTCTNRTRVACAVTNGNATAGVGVAEILAGGTTLSIFLDASAATTYTSGASAGTMGSITFQVN